MVIWSFFFLYTGTKQSIVDLENLTESVRKALQQAKSGEDVKAEVVKDADEKASKEAAKKTAAAAEAKPKGAKTETEKPTEKQRDKI